MLSTQMLLPYSTPQALTRKQMVFLNSVGDARWYQGRVQGLPLSHARN
jgi:hypothetical protein